MTTSVVVADSCDADADADADAASKATPTFPTAKATLAASDLRSGACFTGAVSEAASEADGAATIAFDEAFLSAWAMTMLA